MTLYVKKNTAFQLVDRLCRHSTHQSLRELVQMSIPLLGTSLLYSLIGLSDMYLAGRISASAQVAIGLGDQLLLLLVSVVPGLAVGTTTCVAQAYGAGKLEDAWHYA